MNTGTERAGFIVIDGCIPLFNSATTGALGDNYMKHPTRPHEAAPEGVVMIDHAVRVRIGINISRCCIQSMIRLFPALVAVKSKHRAFVITTNHPEGRGGAQGTSSRSKIRS